MGPHRGAGAAVGAGLAACCGRTVDCEPLHKAARGGPERDKRTDGLDLRERRELYNGFGDTLARAVELVAVPGIFAFAGHLLDGRLGTAPVVTVVLAVFALAGTFVRAYFAYEVAMRAEESKAPWGRSAPARGSSS